MQFQIADLFESLVDVMPDRVALVSGELRLTFAELDRRANQLAHFLAGRGVGAGAHVGLYLFNGNQFVEAILAAFKLRAVPINVNYRYVEDELRFLCRNADLQALVYSEELAPRVAAVAPELPKLRTLIAVSDGESDTEASAAGGANGASRVEIPRAFHYEDALARSAPSRDFAPRDGSDLYIIYTGGTTGMPRGVMWRHEDLFFAGLQGGSPGGEPVARPEELAEQARSGDKALTILPAAPFIHGAAQFAALIALFTGGKAVVSPGRSLQPERVWRLVEREQVHTITLVGDAMARPLTEALERGPAPGAPPRDLSCVGVIASAGAILSGAVRGRLQELLPNVLLLDNFGASETGHQGSSAPDATSTRTSFFMDGTSTVLDEQHRPIAPGSGTVGRLARRGRVPVGYYNDPERTAATFLYIDGERWVLPGDLATIEEDGRITVFGRGAMCINSGGEKIFPEEVEDSLKAHPAVRDALVVGVPDARWGERVAAVVEPQPGTHPTLADLDGHCRVRIAGYKVPRELHLVATIQRHPSGKPDYRWARTVALAAAAQGVADAAAESVVAAPKG